MSRVRLFRGVARGKRFQIGARGGAGGIDGVSSLSLSLTP